MTVTQSGQEHIGHEGVMTMTQSCQEHIDVAQETAANNVTLKSIMLTSSIKRWIGCRLI